MDYVKWIGFVILIVSLGSWIKGRKRFYKEVECNENNEAPFDQQIRWHIEHMREDIHISS